VAAHLCQQVLDTLLQQEFPWSLIQDAASPLLQKKAPVYQSQALPRLSEASLQAYASSPRQAVTRFVVYFAAGEVAEILGRTATSLDYMYDCYNYADQVFQAAIRVLRSLATEKDYDITYLIRSYQRCIEILEERKITTPEMSEKTDQTLLHMLKDALYSAYKIIM